MCNPANYFYIARTFSIYCPRIKLSCCHSNNPPLTHTPTPSHAHTLLSTLPPSAAQTELTEQDLYALLAHNELTDFDPVKEAFKVYAPTSGNTSSSSSSSSSSSNASSGDAAGGAVMDRAVLRSILAASGFQGISEPDIDTLVQALDLDGDGEVGLADFADLVREAGRARSQAQLVQQQHALHQQRQQQRAHGPPPAAAQGRAQGQQQGQGYQGQGQGQ